MSVNVQNDMPDRGVVANLVDQINKLQADLAAFRAIFNAHVHSGITAGGANSAISTTLAAALKSDQLVLSPASQLR